MFEMKNVAVSYGKRQVLSDINLKVDSGEVLAIVGHNGSGKTTLIKSIANLVRVDAGSITMNGVAIENKNPKVAGDAGVRMLPSDYRGVFPSRTVKENLKVAAPKEVYKDRALLEKTMEYCLNIFPALRQKLSQPAGSLSGGQQQMVAMSIALMGRPKLLLLDEPSIGLQPNIVSDMLNEVRKLVDNTGLSVIIVEQNAKVALQIADRVAALRTGKIIHESAKENVSVDDLWNMF